MVTIFPDEQKVENLLTSAAYADYYVLTQKSTFNKKDHLVTQGSLMLKKEKN